MTHVPHELADDFPDQADKIAALRQSNAHFAKLTNAYHAVNRDVHRAETNVQPTTDKALLAMRKERMRLKDEIYSLLKV